MAHTVLPPSPRTARSPGETPSQVSSDVGFFDRFAGSAAGLASRAPYTNGAVDDLLGLAACPQARQVFHGIQSGACGGLASVFGV